LTNDFGLFAPIAPERLFPVLILPFPIGNLGNWLTIANLANGYKA